MSALVVAIDGPSGVGKSTTARRLAERLGVPVLDTGAMYRAAALHVLRNGVSPAERPRAVELAVAAPVEVRKTSDGALEVLLGGESVEPAIRTPEVADATSRLSVEEAVRRRMVELQRRSAELAGAVVEGRDIGTVVFPDTPYKFFLDADPEIRAARRHRQLAGSAADKSLRVLRSELEARDARDRERRLAPLRCDPSYQRIDTSRFSLEEVVEQMMLRVRGGAGPAS